MKTTNFFFATVIAFSVALVACKKDKKDDPATEDNNTSDNKVPTVTQTGPTFGIEDPAPQTANLTATASDEDGTVSKVEFYVDGVKVGEDSSSPYSYEYQFTSNKVYTLKAKAIDNDGASTISSEVSFSVGI